MSASVSPSASLSPSASASPSPEHALVIAKQGATDDVQDLDPKDRAFDSRFPCLKILDAGKYNFTAYTGASYTYTIAFNSDISLPTVILAYMWDPNDSSYKALGSENTPDHTQNYRGRFYYDSSNLYIEVENYTGSTINGHIIYFVGYA